MNALVNVTVQQTMSSREIAELTNKQHRNVTVVIEDLINAQILTAEIQRSTFEHRGNTYRQFLLNKRDSLVVVARLSPEFTAAVIDHWQELENQNTRLPQTFAEALQLAADQARQLELAAPKVEYYDHVVSRDNLLNASQVGQKIKLSAVKLNQILEKLNVYNNTVKRSRVFQQWFVDKGFGLVRQTELGYPQAMFTLTGEAWVIEKLVSEGVIA